MDVGQFLNRPTFVDICQISEFLWKNGKKHDKIL